MNSPCLFSEKDKIRIVWGVRSKCNMKCKHCSANFREEMKEVMGKKDDYRRVLADMGKSGVGEIYLSGGEPLLLDSIFDIIKFGKENNITITLGTNGAILDEEKVKRLRDAGVDKVFMSLDHYQEEKHDFLRNGKVFKKAVKGIEYLKKYGIYTRVDSVIWKDNYQDLDNFVNFCKNLGVNEITFAWTMKVGRAIENDSILPPKSEYFKVGEKLKELKKKYTMPKISYHRFERFDKKYCDCPGGKKIFYMSPAGKVSPCFWINTLLPDFFTEKNIFEEKVSNLFRDKKIKKFIEMEQKRYKDFGPGCPATCLIENNKFHSKDPLLV